MTNKPRPHADVIKAWADGEEIEYRAPGSKEWKPSVEPYWVSDYEYRVKPARAFEKRYIIVELKVPEDLWMEIVKVKS